MKCFFSFRLEGQRFIVSGVVVSMCICLKHFAIEIKFHEILDIFSMIGKACSSSLFCLSWVEM